MTVGSQQRIRREVAIMEEFSEDPRAVRLLGHFETVTHACLVIELCEEGDLLDFTQLGARTMSEEAACRLVSSASMDWL